MKKKFLSLLLTAFLFASLLIPCFGAQETVYIYDNAELLSEQAEAELNKTAASLFETYGIGLYFAADYSYTDAYELSQDAYTLAGAPEKAVVFAITEQQYFFGITDNISGIFTESVQDALWNAYLENDGQTYYDAVFSFMTAAESVLAQALDTYGGIIAKKPLLVDDQNLLTYEEELTVIDKLQSVSASSGVDIVILTTDELNDYGDEVFCDDYYDYNGYGQGTDRSGVLFAFDANDPVGALYYVSTRGSAMWVLSDYVIDEIINTIRYDLKGGAYTSAFTTFADQCAYYYSELAEGSCSDAYGAPDDYGDYSYYHSYTPVKESFGSRAPKYALISLVIGFIIALIVVSSMKAKLKTVRFQSGASNYVKEGSMQLTENRDTFLYHKVTSRPRPQNPPASGGGSHSGGHSGGGSHISSSGASHGGHGGRL